MAEIAVLGYGTVGSGVVEVLRKNRASIEKKAAQPVVLKYILDVRKFPGSPDENLITDDIEKILTDDSIKIIVEAIGGVNPAYSYVKRALLSGKSVCTSNKELVAKHGAELLMIAREKNINFLFEASVGGGIPIIRPLNQSLTADEIYEITGILNGTSNYILSKMQQEGADFNSSLKKAQEFGYAEADPSADVDGFDSCRKLAILLSLALGKQVDFENISTEGIGKIAARDVEYAVKNDFVIKLIAEAKIFGPNVYAQVAPALLPAKHPLSSVNGVYNAIYIKGNIIGEIMFYGLGAGKYPTASAVVADVVDAVKHLNRNIIHFWSEEKHELADCGDIAYKRYVRVKANDPPKARAAADKIFNGVHSEEYKDELIFLTGKVNGSDFNKNLEVLLKNNGVFKIQNVMRIGDEA